MTPLLVNCAGSAALIAGVLRIASTFIPYSTDSISLEVLYAVIDLGLLFATIGIYLDNKNELGLAGLAGFTILISGIASIVGPDAHFLGADIYGFGVQVIALGSVVLSVSLLRARRLMGTASLFVASVAIGILGTLSALGDWAWTIAGLLFGSAYVFAGLHMLRRKSLTA